MAWEGFFEAKNRLELGGKQGREREAVPPRLPSGWAAGLVLDRLRGVFREPHGTTADGWEDAEEDWSGVAPPFLNLHRRAPSLEKAMKE